MNNKEIDNLEYIWNTVVEIKGIVDNKIIWKHPKAHDDFLNNWTWVEFKKVLKPILNEYEKMKGIFAEIEEVIEQSRESEEC